MYQSTTSDIIRVRCAAAHTTTALDISCDAKILDNATGRLDALVPFVGVSNGTSNVTVSTAPASGKNKAVEALAVVNRDTVAHTVIVEWSNGTTTVRKHPATVLQSGESLVYSRGDWSVYSPTGKEILVGETGDPGTNGTNGTNGTDGAGLPTGGTTGQLIRKASATDFDTAWADADSILTGAISPILTTDLTANRQLISNASGKIAATPGVGNFGFHVFLPESGGFLGTQHLTELSVQSVNANTQRIVPWSFPWPVTIDRIGFSVSTGIASTSARAVIFDSDANGRPSTLLATSANIDTSSAATVFDSGFSFSFAPHKWYWLGMWYEAAITQRQPARLPVIGWNDSSTPANFRCLNRALSYGSANTDWTFANSQLSTLISPLLLMRVA